MRLKNLLALLATIFLAFNQTHAAIQATYAPPPPEEENEQVEVPVDEATRVLVETENLGTSSPILAQFSQSAFAPTTNTMYLGTTNARGTGYSLVGVTISRGSNGKKDQITINPIGKGSGPGVSQRLPPI